MADEGRQDHVTFDDLEKLLLLLQGDQDLNSQEMKDMIAGVLLHMYGFHAANNQLIKSLYTWIAWPDLRRSSLFEDSLDALGQLQDGLTQREFHPTLMASYQQQIQDFRDFYQGMQDALASNPPESKA